MQVHLYENRRELFNMTARRWTESYARADSPAQSSPAESSRNRGSTPSSSGMSSGMGYGRRTSGRAHHRIRRAWSVEVESAALPHKENIVPEEDNCAGAGAGGSPLSLAGSQAAGAEHNGQRASEHRCAHSLSLER